MFLKNKHRAVHDGCSKFSKQFALIISAFLEFSLTFKSFSYQKSSQMFIRSINIFLGQTVCSFQQNSFTAIIVTSLYMSPSFSRSFLEHKYSRYCGEKRGEKNVLIHLLCTLGLHVKDIVHRQTRFKHIGQSQYMSNNLYNDHGKILLLKKLLDFILPPYFPG